MITSDIDRLIEEWTPYKVRVCWKTNHRGIQESWYWYGWDWRGPTHDITKAGVYNLEVAEKHIALCVGCGVAADAIGVEPVNPDHNPVDMLVYRLHKAQQAADSFRQTAERRGELLDSIKSSLGAQSETSDAPPGWAKRYLPRCLK
jgi:hypothetical protein